MHLLTNQEVATFTTSTQKSSLLGHVDAGSNDSELLNGTGLIDGIPEKHNIVLYHSAKVCVCLCYYNIPRVNNRLYVQVLQVP